VSGGPWYAARQRGEAGEERYGSVLAGLDGEDLVQAALLKVFVRWTRAGGIEAPVAYARRVLYTTFWSWSGRRWSAEIPTGDVPELASPDPYEATTTGQVHAALVRLPRRTRAILIARFYEDLSVQQTARLLGCPESTVKNHTARGLERLRHALSADVSNLEGT